jgi:hypothetical protein
MPKVFIIVLLPGLVLMTGRMQLKGKLSDKMGHEAEARMPYLIICLIMQMVVRVQCHTKCSRWPQRHEGP